MKLIDAEQVRELFVSWQNGAGDDWDSFLRRLAALPDATPPAQWQPIESAPKDGTWILVWWPYWAKTRPIVAKWFPPNSQSEDAGWDSIESLSSHHEPPTHWMPLPPAPGDAPCVARLGNLTTTVTGLDE